MASSLTFTVQRCQPELIAPAAPTPHELKRLSDIDDQEGLRSQLTVIQFYRHDALVGGRRDPVMVIREALAKALVFYYPLAGRLREGADRKLAVECTGEGVVFIGADANVRLEQFGDSLQPPFPCLEEFLFDVEGSSGVLGCPLILIQVTRLSCGGFILALRLSHVISDMSGHVQFMTAVGEIARGATAPTVQPVWARHLLEARSPPCPILAHREYDVISDTKNNFVPLDDMVQRSFFFGRREIAALRRRVPHHLRSCTTFEILTASLWKCRTSSIQVDPFEEVRIMCSVDSRGKFNPPLPAGYYGNALALPVSVAEAGKVANNPLEYALELVKKAKAQVTEEYMRSVADLLVIKGRPHFTTVRTFMVSDLRRAGFRDVDFGWGKAVYGGAAKAGFGDFPDLTSFLAPSTNRNGEDGIVVPICLPGPAMERFAGEIERLTIEEEHGTTAQFRVSAL